MKTLVLVRHAKSDWGYEFLKDIDRPLNERGYRDAYAQSQWYKNNYSFPDIIISSPAIRAVSTALIFSRMLEYNEQNIHIMHGIYEAVTDDFLDNIHKLSNEINIAMFVGHNPVLTHLFNLLSHDIYIDNIPTCGIVKLEFNIEHWKEVGNQKSISCEYKFVK